MFLMMRKTKASSTELADFLAWMGRRFPRSMDRQTSWPSELYAYNAGTRGNIAFSPRLQRTPIATEAMFLMMQRVFNELGYRRYEWKCDSCNAVAPRSAAVTFDGLFPQTIVYKGRNRDTTWFSMLDKDWPQIEKVYETSLSPDNFEADGQQKEKLSQTIERFRKT